MSSSATHGRTVTTGPVLIDESLTASQLRSLVADQLILVSYDGGTKFGILTEAQLAGIAMSTEVVVTWYEHGEHLFGIIVGYQDPKPGKDQGVFVIDVVEDSQSWPETGSGRKLKRSDFVVFGPANRDPGDGPGAPDDLSNMGHGHGWVPEEGPLAVALPIYAESMLPYLLCAIDIMGMKTEIGNPTFKVRLDTRPSPSGGHRFRVGVQPVKQPIMHDELHDVLQIASKHELAVSTSSSGLDITAPEDVV